MKRLSLEHLSNEVVERELKTKAVKEKGATAELLVYIGEFDERKLYLPAAYESMLAYCVGELGLSQDEAKKRIQVARAARDCPAMLEALAEGRVHLSGLRLLAPHITPGNAEELLAAATRKTWHEIDELLAARSPRPAVEARVEAVASSAPMLAAGEGAARHLANTESQGVTGESCAPGRVRPLSAEAYAVQFTQSRDDHEMFRYLQDLLGHKVPRGDIARVYALAVKELVAKMERVRFGVCSRPRSGQLSSNSRYIPNNVKRAVFKRDGGQCTYTSESGRRCEVRGDVEFDHVNEFARGGEGRVENVQLRCRGHNQHTAEQTYGAGFMQQKREEAAAARSAARAAKERAQAEKAAAAEASRLQPHQLEVIPWLRELGCRQDHCRIAVERCREMADAPLEARVKRALSWFGDRISRKVSYAPAHDASPQSGATPYSVGQGV